jgi:hypothetical protein
MTIDAIIRTIQLMLAPVVMVTACTSYINMLSFDYQFIVSNIRSISREHLDLLQAASSNATGVSVSTLDAVSKERLHEIENELPSLLQRHGFIRNALLCINIAILIFIASMFFIAVAEFTNIPPGAFIALLTFLVGIGMVFIGVVQIIRDHSRSHGDVIYEAMRSLKYRFFPPKDCATSSCTMGISSTLIALPATPEGARSQEA